jgi:pimeloyl-ACP methyl ester carboxylesterase
MRPPALEAMAHTLVYDATIMGESPLSTELLANVGQPTLAIAGGASPPFLREVADALARSLPNGRSVTIEGATHDIVPDILGPALERFFGSARERLKHHARTLRPARGQ